MIGFLRGTLIHQQDSSLILETGGVGYELTVSSTVLEQGLNSKDEIALFVHTDLKENSLTLFGFSSLFEREIFLLLRKVNGVGPRTALGIVSAIGPVHLLQIIHSEDHAALRKVPGVGKKTAERVVVELREQVAQLLNEVGKVGNHSLETTKITKSSGSGSSLGARDAILALEKLGFNTTTAEDAVSLALTKHPQLNLEDAQAVLRQALANLPLRA